MPGALLAPAEQGWDAQCGCKPDSSSTSSSLSKLTLISCLTRVLRAPSDSRIRNVSRSHLRSRHTLSKLAIGWFSLRGLRLLLMLPSSIGRAARQQTVSDGSGAEASLECTAQNTSPPRLPRSPK